jgi:hypothetical protein
MSTHELSPFQAQSYLYGNGGNAHAEIGLVQSAPNPNWTPVQSQQNVEVAASGTVNNGAASILAGIRPFGVSSADARIFPEHFKKVNAYGGAQQQVN